MQAGRRKPGAEGRAALLPGGDNGAEDVRNTVPPPETTFEAEPVGEKSRRWTLHVIALLLLVQGLGLIAISIYYASRLSWERELIDVKLSVVAMDAIVFGVLFIPLAVVEVVTVFGVWFAESGAWLRAMIIQGFLLSITLINYLSGHPMGILYLVMLSCIVIVLYLNTSDVWLAFYGRKR